MKTFQVNRDSVSFSVMDDEVVIIHTETSDYFGVNQPGSYLWNLMLDRHCSMDELSQSISSGYGVDEGEARKDVAAFLDSLVDSNLVLTNSDNTSSSDSVELPTTSVPPAPYEPPDLVRFGDLETLILSGE